MSGSSNFGVLEKNHLQAVAFYKHSYSDAFYKGDSIVDFKYLINGYFDYSGLNLSYGFTKKFTAQADLGYYINKTQNYYPDLPIPVHQLVGHGLADLSLLFKYNLFNSRDSVLSLTVSGGGKLPTGSYQEYTKEKVKLPRDVQSGTGAYSAIGGLDIKIVLAKKIPLLVSSKAEWNSLNPENYQYGLSVTSSMATSIKIYKHFSFFLMVKNENRKHDFDAVVNQEIASSGYFKLIAMPGFTCSFKNEWETGVYADLPVYQKYNGTQFGNKYAVSASVSKQFKLKKG